MTDKIIFWLDAFLLHFGLSHYLKKKFDCELYSIIDITNRTKQFFEEQNLVNFKKQWFLHDYIKKSNSKPDIEYLTNFGKKYSINIWQLGFNERIFYKYNDFHKFTQDEILYILEQECKLYEKILDEVKPDFLFTLETALHQQHLFYEICKKRGIKVLMLHQSKLGYRCLISPEMHKLDPSIDLAEAESQNRNFDELLKHFRSFDSSKQLTDFRDNFLNSRTDQINALVEYLFKYDNPNLETHFSYYGRNKLRVLSKYFSNTIKAKKRKSFIDKNFQYEIPDGEASILFPLQQDPERSTLIATPYYTNQIEVVRHIAKSIPINHVLYVKEHFSQVFREWRKISDYKEIMDIPNVRLFHPSVSIEKLLKHCSLVISIGGTTSFEAAFYQKPSILVADYGFTILPSIYKLNSLEDLPDAIRKSLQVKVNSDDLDKYLNILESNTFDFDLKGYEVKEAKFFRYGGSFHDTKITSESMEEFLKENQDYFKILVDEHIKKIKQLKNN